MTVTTADTHEVDTHRAAPPEATRRPGLNTDTLALAGVFIAMFAFLAAVFAVGLASRAVDEHQDLEDAIAAGAPTGSSPGSATAVSLREFAIDPGSLELASGSTIRIENAGTIAHNLSVDGRGSAMLEAGQSGELDLSGLAPGTYTMRCDVPGHEAAGMKGTVTVT